MRQSRVMSLIEALANVVVGYGVAVGVQVLVFPMFGFSATLDENLAIGDPSRRRACDAGGERIG